MFFDVAYILKFQLYPIDYKSPAIFSPYKRRGWYYQFQVYSFPGFLELPLRRGEEEGFKPNDRRDNASLNFTTQLRKRALRCLWLTSKLQYEEEIICKWGWQGELLARMPRYISHFGAGAPLGC